MCTVITVIEDAVGSFRDEESVVHGTAVAYASNLVCIVRCARALAAVIRGGCSIPRGGIIYSIVISDGPLVYHSKPWCTQKFLLLLHGSLE